MRNIFTKLILMAVTLSGISCGEDIADCPNKMCLLSGGWILVEVYVDGVKDNSNLSAYRLFLSEPAIDAVSSSFDRIQPSGNQDTGNWSTQNNDQILRLVPNDDPLLTEDYIIESFTLRQLVLVINRDSNKTGPEQIKFILEPL